ncbi:MAG TPA: DNA polymerase III subunit alpha, partial [Candidatus Dorea merdavium]|nr:DNA polymerase III subunit alpha [Candidatus Dorea merdavium]
EDEKPHDILLCIQTGKKIEDEDRMRYEGGQYYIKSEEEMRELFPYAPQALENTERIARRCNVEIEFGVTKLPKFDVPEGYTSWEYLNKLCREGFARRYPDAGEELKERLEYELSTIHSMGYVDYFLIVWDFIRYARDHGIMVGPGRGSAAGSIVAYCLEITSIDPIKYQLLFERFLNPERVSMPDIDVDFCFERRQEVIDYVVRKYGSDRVVQIVTFGTLAARGVIRDVGRVMDLPYAFVDSIAKMVPQELNITLERALKMSQELKKSYEDDPRVRELIDMSMRLEGLPRHTSMHAAGVVISQKAIDEYVPLSLGSDGSVTTQFTMTTLEELGLLKMDFLGLRTLTVIQDAARLAEKSAGHPIDINQIDYNDKAVLDSIGTGKTDGVFQLESAGMKSFMKELKPQSLEDIIAGISLYRPGPMDFIPKYIKGKNNADSITYDCPQLKPILEPTYGCIVYQEQVMQIVRDLGGYTLGRSDLVRRAMSKKKGDVMQKERQNFVYGNPEEGVPGCVSNGIDEKTANKIYDEMIDFAKYAFNKSHAAAYAVVAYQTAWLKYYYPVEFMAALMTSVIDNPGKVAEYIYTCRQMGIGILPPDINEGVGNFSVDGGNIRYGLAAIKSIGRPVIESLIRERESGGKFRSLKDFIERMSGKEVNKRTIEHFIKSGAFDSLGGTRKQFMVVYVQLMDQVNQERKYSMTGQMSLFDLVGEEEKAEFDTQMPDVGEYEKETRLSFEKEVLGVYLSGHPMEEYEERWRKGITRTTLDFQLDEETGRTRVHDGVKETVGGIIAGKTIKYTKNNKTMAFLTIEDLAGTVEVVVFPRDYEKYQQYLTEENKVFVRGRVSEEDDAASKLICEAVIPFDQTRKELWLQYEAKADFLSREQELYELLGDSEGDDQVVIYCRKERAVKRLPQGRNIHIDSIILNRLTNYLGESCVKVIEKPIENNR